jgi:hypothetical protein
MNVISADARLTRNEPGALAHASAGSWTHRSLVVLAAFGLYWLSAVILQSRSGTTHFGADAHLYSLIAQGFTHDRLARFHPLTTVVAAAWMKLLSPLTSWIPLQVLLKAMFAAVGALGVWAAIAAFAAVAPHRTATLLGVIYAASLGVWYFSSIEESKIVSATLVALYIATYLRLRSSWTAPGAVLLTVILLLACLNEIVAALLLVIPAVDALVRGGWRWRGNLWIAAHALAAPLALLFLEVVVNGRLVDAATNPEGASHLSMLMFYMSQNDFSADTFYWFAIRWWFFNLAAPSLDATNAADFNYAGDYGPDVTLASYFSSPVSAALVLVFGVILVACVLPRYRRDGIGDWAGVLLGLAAYALLRAAFFFAVYPGECLLFASGVTLAHLLLIAMPFATSRFPHKEWLLRACAALLLITNGSFIIGR